MNNIKISTWNVNSIKSRFASFEEYVRQHQDDIILLQEIKCLDENFPHQQIQDLGYNIALKGQKTYNGVAILSKYPIEEVIEELPSYGIDDNDQQARYIEAVISTPNKPIRVASIYVPNGGSILQEDQKNHETEKFIYKMNFFDRLKIHLEKLFAYDEIAIFGGDYNVGVEEIDVFDPKNLKNTICFHDLERQKMHAILNSSYIDLFRAQNPQKQEFTWWDYRGNSFSFNKGMRIDYLLASPLAADHANICQIIPETRAHQKPSDHCPVSVTISIK